MMQFRELEKNKLLRFVQSTSDRAMAIYGRRRTGKTLLVTDFCENLSNEDKNKCVYYQCTSYDYATCLKDFIEAARFLEPESGILDNISSFKDFFRYICKTHNETIIYIIDEFPFLAVRNEDVAVEFQWIIDHALGSSKLILLGSSLSFMKRQISDRKAPLYGRFDSILEIRPFTFREVLSLFPDFTNALNVYAKTGGVAQYVMYYKNYPSVREADEELFFNPDGRLLMEAENLLMQELRDINTYALILRAIGSSAKESGSIAKVCNMDQRAVFSYLNKLTELSIVSQLDNPLSSRKYGKRYYISDMLFRFHYSLLEPHISLINATREKSMPVILSDRYSEYLGFVYEEIIRGLCFEMGAEGTLPFVPLTVGKWWGNICENGAWSESEVDVLAYDDHNIIIGECKYRNKAIGRKELDALRLKSQFIPVQKRKIYYLLASKNGFTEELLGERDEDVILLEGIEVVV